MSVQSGLDFLLAGKLNELRGRNVGVLCHHASVDRSFRHIAFHLKDAEAEGLLKVKAAFSPEHGLWGAQDARIESKDEPEPRTGFTVHSLYGQTYRPTREMMEGIDAFVIDLQDVGARFYTFTWSMAHCLSACEEFGVPAIVLDRPNPIGGTQVEGPVLEPQFSSFIGLHPVAQRHGMTFGEIATWLKKRSHPRLNLRVIRCNGWRREMPFEETGLPWIVPSPNMPRVETAYVYPGICLLEGTSMSEGRGTTRPFETFGHPKIDGWKLAEKLNGMHLKGAMFRPLYFQPTWSKNAGQGCGGCFLHVTDRSAFEPVMTSLAILASVMEQAPEALSWDQANRRTRFDRLAGCSWLRESLTAKEPLHAIRERIESSSKAFLAERSASFLYD